MATQVVLEVEEDLEFMKAKAKIVEELSKVITFRTGQDLKEVMKTRPHQSQRVSEGWLRHQRPAPLTSLP